MLSTFTSIIESLAKIFPSLATFLIGFLTWYEGRRTEKAKTTIKAAEAVIENNATIRETKQQIKEMKKDEVKKFGVSDE